jgi:aerobic-type carbon monoxide dehydrogenase small subunit (CoxS/CutS family)
VPGLIRRVVIQTKCSCIAASHWSGPVVVQQAWLDEDVAQCGFCQPGQIMQAAAMLKKNKTPTDTDIDGIMNVFRIRKAIKRAAGTI